MMLILMTKNTNFQVLTSQENKKNKSLLNLANSTQLNKYNRLSIIRSSAFNKDNLELILFSKTLSFNFISTAIAIDVLVFLRMDKNIWRQILNLADSRG